MLESLEACALMLLLVLALVSTSVAAQDPAVAPNGPPNGPANAPANGPVLQDLEPGRLDQLLAPIALYPDPLLSQVLMAATYPVEIVQAARWLEKPANASLSPDQLAAAVAQQSWDPSVKSLTAFPAVLRMLDGNLDWTSRLGNVFLANQAAVMDAVQGLRQRAQAAGRLRSTPEQAVSTQDQMISINPPDPAVVYVPVYDPTLAYGAWPYAGYPPYYFPGYFDGVAIGGFGIGWLGFGVIGPLWGWGRFDWRGHDIHIDSGRFAALNGGRAPGSGSWSHDASHRGGVRYPTGAASSRFAASAASARMAESRGYAGTRAQSRSPEEGAARAGGAAVYGGSRVAAPRASYAPAPTFESYGRGEDVHAQAQRGQASRSSSFAAPSGGFHGGGGGGGGGHGGGGGAGGGGGGGGGGHGGGGGGHR